MLDLLQLAKAWLLALALVASACAPAVAAKHALVVGIDSYDHLSPERQLTRAGSDAKVVASTLRDLGFDVIEAVDVTRRTFNTLYQQLVNRVAPGDTVVVYFAGHGIEIEGRNLLLARDVPSMGGGEEEILKGEAIPVASLLETLRSRKPGVILAIIDACRSNPFARAGTRSLGGTRGLGAERPPEGTFVLYAAGAGEEALDFVDNQDRHPNSLFARHLLPLMRQPGLEFPDLARALRRQVREAALAARHSQTPAYYDEVVGRFCLAGCNAASQPPPSAALDLAPSARPPPASAPRSGEPPVHDCDHAAAAPLDHRRLTTGVPFDKLDAVRAIHSCEAAIAGFPGTARFEFQLGRAYEKVQRFQDAAKLYQAAALRDDDAAMTSLGIMYADGLGVVRNSAEALRLLRQAAARGNAPAMHNLGSMYADGRGVTRDTATAAQFFVSALIAGGIATLKEFKSNTANYRPDLRRAVVERLKRDGHFAGPASDRFSPEVVATMERLVASANQR